jgi:hypothetical protein
MSKEAKKAKKTSSKKKGDSRDASPKERKKARKESSKKSHTPRSDAHDSLAPPKAPMDAELSQTLQIPDVSELAMCPKTGKPYTYFCESKEELLCDECVATSSSYRLLPIAEAYRIRLAMFYNTLNTHLFAKKEKILSQIHLLEYHIEMIKREKLGIERDMKGEFSAMSDRLQGSYGSKTAILTHQITELQGDLERMNEIIRTVETSQDVVSFLRQSKDLRDSMEVVLSKPTLVNVAVSPGDLPCELAGIRS